MIKADRKYRANKASLNEVYVKNDHGNMAPVNSFIDMQRVYGPQSVSRFNLYNAVQINGSSAPGYSSGDALEAVSRVSDEVLPSKYSYDYSGTAREEQATSGQSAIIFALSVIFIYFLLSAQYESYLIPLSVLLPLPIGLSGSFLFADLAGVSNNIYLQISLVMLIGLLAKNAILIVEFALQRRQEGMAIAEAAIRGAKVRLRPILMTSFAFIFGLLPLALATGVAANGNQSIGLAAIGGMLIGTLFGIFVIPILFIIFQNLQEKITGVQKR
jgi:HAE1 family hydrophobic/amphiphilic exporter-1